MQIRSVHDLSFRKYGRVVTGIDVAPLVEAMKDTPCPQGVAYEPSVAALEQAGCFGQIRDLLYGGMPIEIGYCNGTNHAMNALEYHRDSELNLACTDLVLLLGWQADIEGDLTYDTARVEGFSVPAGTLVELYATTLHYAPIGDQFRCAVVLPRGTNAQLPFERPAEGEGRLLMNVNKWLIAHPDAHIGGAWAGLKGANPTA